MVKKFSNNKHIRPRELANGQKITKEKKFISNKLTKMQISDCVFTKCTHHSTFKDFCGKSRNLSLVITFNTTHTDKWFLKEQMQPNVNYLASLHIYSSKKRTIYSIRRYSFDFWPGDWTLNSWWMIFAFLKCAPLL